MIVIHLLVLDVQGKSRAKPRLVQPKDEDPNEYWGCLSKARFGVSSSEISENGLPVAYYTAFGTCCAQYPTVPECKSYGEACRAEGEDRDATIESFGKTAFESMCDAWCDEESAEWCSSGLGAGAIAGIVVGVVAVGGGVAGVLVYFFVCKKAAVAAAAAGGA
jgi:hypothetical protein